VDVCERGRSALDGRCALRLHRPYRHHNDRRQRDRCRKNRCSERWKFGLGLEPVRGIYRFDAFAAIAGADGSNDPEIVAQCRDGLAMSGARDRAHREQYRYRDRGSGAYPSRLCAYSYYRRRPTRACAALSLSAGLAIDAAVAAAQQVNPSWAACKQKRSGGDSALARPGIHQPAAGRRRFTPSWRNSAHSRSPQARRARTRWVRSTHSTIRAGRAISTIVLTSICASVSMPESSTRADPDESKVYRESRFQS